ncbi:MAG: type II toxin-antitoxin system RelE/ParE family toxin [Candidatus Omnitrophota bacterium]|jgi:toxin ParE1/3/4|nr:MAG: type II toxin-antitoxin system RelE/ParE family toxin [Candidatus Omnitrophota bacterium]
MMHTYFLTPQAIHDLNEIHDYTAKNHPRNALQFVDLLEEKCLEISQSPEIGKSRNELAPRLRSFPFRNYIIFYRPISSGVEIIRILHGYRDVEAIFMQQCEK